MVNKTVIILIVIDIIVIGVIVFYGVNGFRRGSIKSFISFLLLCISFIAAIILYEWPSMYLQIALETSTPRARVVCFSSIFIIFMVTTRFVYYMISKLFKQVLDTGVINRIMGLIFGIMEGFLIIGIIFMTTNFYPVTSPLKDTISFKVMKDIPVDLRDTSLWFLPSMKDSLAQEEFTVKEKIKQKKINSKEDINL